MYRRYVIVLVALAFLMGCAGQSRVSDPSASETEPVVLAIAPFTNVVGQKNYDWIGVGMGEAISTKLGNLPSFQLVERIKLSDAISEMKLGQSGLVDESTATKLGKLVGAEQLLTGSYQVMGNSIRVDVRILEIETGKVYKTAGANGTMDNLFDLQDRLTASLLTALGLPVSPEEKSQISSRPTTSPEAFQLYSQAADTYTPEGRALSDEDRINYLEQSTRLDPNFAMAYLLLGDIYARRAAGYGQAVIYYQKVTVIQPTSQIARTRLVQVYQKQGNYVAAGNEKARLDRMRRDYFQRIAPYQAARNRAIMERRVQLRGPSAVRGWDQRRVAPGSSASINRNNRGPSGPAGSGGIRQPAYNYSAPRQTGGGASNVRPVYRPQGNPAASSHGYRPAPSSRPSGGSSKSTSKSKR